MESRRKILLVGLSLASASALLVLLRPWAGQGQALEDAAPRSAAPEPVDPRVGVDLEGRPAAGLQVRFETARARATRRTRAATPSTA